MQGESESECVYVDPSYLCRMNLEMCIQDMRDLCEDVVHARSRLEEMFGAINNFSADSVIEIMNRVTEMQSEMDDLLKQVKEVRGDVLETTNSLRQNIIQYNSNQLYRHGA